MRIDISSIKEDKPVKIVLLMEHRHINLVFFYKTNKKTNKSYIEVKQLYYTYSGANYIDKSIIEVEYQKTGFGYRKFFKCPHCSKKRKYLYPVGIGLFSCRDCIERNVYAYRTNIYDENIENVIKYKISLLFDKLGSDLRRITVFNLLISIPDKPKYMRWSKYELICKQIHFLNYIYHEIINGRIKRFKARELKDMLNKINVEFVYDRIIYPSYNLSEEGEIND